MTKRYSFIFLNNAGSRIRQISSSSSALTGSILVITAAFIVLCWLSYEFIRLKKNTYRVENLTSQIEHQNEEIQDQRRQIQGFAEQINGLKDRLARLDEFERRIKIIANLEEGGDEQNSIFGVGGSMPDDLDAGIELARRHDDLLRDMHEQMDQLNLWTLDKEKQFDTLLKQLEYQSNILASTPTICPVQGSITSGFGYRKSPFTGRREMHKGLDIANRIGTPIIAPANGVVSFAGARGSLGNIIILDHGHGIMTRYAHTLKTLKKIGEQVKRGDIIAEIGNTGRSSGPHLHYEVCINGVPVNPQKFIIESAHASAP
jgi:murein DD-endopeptidase MepM/ murein hydrolase activator NlpD